MVKIKRRCLLFGCALIFCMSAALLVLAGVTGGARRAAFAAETAAPAEDYALAFKPYVIKDYHTSTAVTDPRGDAVVVQDGRFTPMNAGIYRITTSGETRYVTVFQTIPRSDYAFSHAMNDEYATGELIRLPRATVTSAIEINAEYHIFIEFDGVVIERYEKGDAAVFQPKTAGEYKAVFTYVDYFGFISNQVLSFTVKDEPVIAFAPPESLAYQKSFKISPVYAYYASKSVQAELTVSDPDGEKLDLSSGSFVTSKLGGYTFTVSAEIGGVQLSETYTVSCGLYNRYLFEATKLAKEPVSGVPLPDNCNIEGNGVLLEGTTSGATFTYSNIVNLNEITRDQNILSFLPYVTDSIGYTDTLEVILTDAHDPYNKVSIQFKRSPFHDNLTYVTGAHNERHYAFDNENWVLTGEDGPVKIGDKYFFGGIMRNRYSMIGASDMGLNLYSFTMDYPGREMVLDLTSEGEGRYTLVDFDNPVWVGGSQYTWNGFTTGEVYLSLEFGTITGKSAAIIVTEVMGQSVSGERNADTVKPAITIDIDEDYLSDMPYGVVNEFYRLPEVSAEDVVCGTVPVQTKLILNGNPVTLQGGGFMPQSAGVYRLEYTAVDANGNTAKKTLTVEIKERAPDISVLLGDYTPPLPGTYFTLPEIEVKYASGKYSVKRTVSVNGTQTEPDLAGNVFIDRVGEVRVRVEVTDWLGKTMEKTFIVEIAAELPVMSIPYKPGNAQPGQTLTFLPAELSDFSDSGSAQIERNIYVNDELLSDNNYTVKNGETVLYVQYEVNVNGQMLSETFTVPIMNGLSDRFVTDGDVSVGGENSDEVHFTFDTDGYFALANPVSHNELRVSFLTPKFHFEYLDVTFTDYNNPNISVFLRFTPYSATQVRAQLNGTGDYYLLNGSMENGTPITFFYDSDNRLFKTAVSEKTIFDIVFCKNGNVFNGFPSGGVRTKFALHAVTEQSSVRIAGISNETFVTYLLTGKDSVAPVISTGTEKEEFNAEYGSTYTVGRVKAFDVLQGMFDVKISVIAPDGTYLYDKAPICAEMNFMFDQYGEYVVVYETVDSDFTVRGLKEIYIDVKDGIPPKITLNGEIQSSAALGNRITLPSMAVTDNITVNPMLRIFIYDPNYKNIIVSAGDSYRFTTRGQYKIVYYAKDEAGNITRLEYIVEVK